MNDMFNSAFTFDQDLCPWNQAPAVVNDNDVGMFKFCSGGPQKFPEYSFDASQCVSYSEI